MPTLPTPGQWPDLRRDAQISGHQPLPGAITKPEIAWRQRLGGPIFDAHTFVLDKSTMLLLTYGGCLICHDITGATVWRTAPHGIEGVIGIDDVDDDGNLEILASNGRSFFVFDARTGRTLYQYYLGPPRSGGFIYVNALLHRFDSFQKGAQLSIGMLSSKEVVLFDFASGASSPELAHTFRIEDFFHPSILAIDIDDDGIEELVVTKLSSVYAFDPLSGKLKTECVWLSGGDRKRNYGLFEGRNLNNDDRTHLLLLSYVVSRHIAVVENDGNGRLHNKWDRFIGHIYPHDETELRYCWNSCLDIDGDGRLEIVASIWQDGSWHTEVIDAWSGETRCELPELYLSGIFPGDQNVTPFLFLSRETTRLPSLTGSTILFQWRETQLVPVWEGTGLTPLGRFPRRSATKTAFRIEPPPDEDIWWGEIGGTLTFLMIDEKRNVHLLQKTNEVWETTLLPTAENVAAILALEDIDQDGEAEIIYSDWSGKLHTIRPDGSIIFAAETGMRYRYGASLYFYAKPFGQPVVAATDGGCFCAVPDGGERIYLFRWDSQANLLNRELSLVGRGRVGPEEGHHSPVFIQREGKPALLLSDVGRGGNGTLRIIDLKGSILQEYKLPSLPMNPPFPRGRTGIHEYRMIETAEDPILVVSGFRTGSMNSEITVGLCATTGRILWQRTTISEETEAAFAPWNAMTVCEDLENPQVVFLAKDTFCHVNAKTGEFVAPPWQLRPFNTVDLKLRGISTDDFSAYGTPSLTELNRSGEHAWILLCNYGGMGAINLDHSVRWWKSFPLPTLTTSFGGIADVDNDGITEIGLSLADGDFVCLRADTGLEKWRLHLGTVAADVVTCDIDGDGRIEFILGTREGKLMAVGSSLDGVGTVKWSLDFDFSLGPPIIADINGDGSSEVLVVGGDGWLYGIRNRTDTIRAHD